MKPNQLLTSAQVRATIESAGNGASFKAKLRDVASRVHCGETTLYRYLKDGAKPGSANKLLCQMATEHKIIEREPGAGQMIL